MNFSWWIVITHSVLKQSWILHKHRSYFLLSCINSQKKILCSKWNELSQRKISALSLTSAILPVLPLLKEFIMKLKIHVSLMELLLLLSLYHLSWAEKNNDLNIIFYKYLFWQQWQLNLPALCTVKNDYFETGSVPSCNSAYDCTVMPVLQGRRAVAETMGLNENRLSKQAPKLCIWIHCLSPWFSYHIFYILVVICVYAKSM